MRRLAVVAIVLLAAGACGGGGTAISTAAERMLIVSLPGVSWADVRADRLPNLARLAGDGAIGNLATRIGRSESSIEAAYLTIGAGTRAIAPAESRGVALEPSEIYHGEPAANVLRRRLGSTPTGLAYLAIGGARDSNEASAFGADVGTLGDLLADGGVDRAVVANGDLREGRADDGAYGRGAVAVVMGSDGLVPHGDVGRALLVDDPTAPFGVRLDHVAVVAAFDAAWSSPRTVVVVEASDLHRARAYSRLSSSARRKEMRLSALEEADALLGALLDRVSDRDAVLVVSPVAPLGAPDLAIAALRAPGVQRGLLLSATTRRAGYVQLADIAPTVLATMAIDTPDSIEGRPFHVEGDRHRRPVVVLDDARKLAAFRDSIVPATVTVLIALLVALTVLTVFRRRLPRVVVRGIPIVAAGALGALPATFLSAALDVQSTGSYVALLVATGVLVASVSTLADHRRPGLGPILAVSSVVGLIAVDVVVGAPLQLNTVFGYSVAVAGRFAGVGNLAFALFGSGALVLAALVAERRGKRGGRLALAVLVMALLVDGLPNLGADVGGVLSMVPAFGLSALVLMGRPIRVREVGGLIVGALLALLAVAFIDLARPAGSQTHLARLAQHVLDWEWKPFLHSLSRRWSASFGDGQTGAWVVLIVLFALVAATLLLRVVPRGEPLPELGQPERAAAVGLAALAGLGLVANDSSFAVPFTMLLVVAPVVIHRLAAAEVAR